MPGLFFITSKKSPCIPKFVLNNPELNDPKKFGLFWGFFRLFRGFIVFFFGYFRPFFGNVTFSQTVFRLKNYFQQVIQSVFLMMVKNLRTFKQTTFTLSFKYYNFFCKFAKKIAKNRKFLHLRNFLCVIFH